MHLARDSTWNRLQSLTRHNINLLVVGLLIQQYACMVLTCALIIDMHCIHVHCIHVHCIRSVGVRVLYTVSDL